MLLPNFHLCLAASGTEDSNKYRVCPGIAFSDNIKITIISPHPLPPNLAVAFNGKKLFIDECGPENDSPLGSIKLNPNRTRVTLFFYPNRSPENNDFYFPNGPKKPASNQLGLTIYDRDKCTDPHSLFQEVSDAKISWKPVYSKGEHCGLTHYEGKSQIDL